jgi:hypothetical protein
MLFGELGSHRRLCYSLLASLGTQPELVDTVGSVWGH